MKPPYSEVLRFPLNRSYQRRSYTLAPPRCVDIEAGQPWGEIGTGVHVVRFQADRSHQRCSPKGNEGDGNPVSVGSFPDSGSHVLYRLARIQSGPFLIKPLCQYWNDFLMIGKIRYLHGSFFIPFPVRQTRLVPAAKAKERMRMYRSHTF